jgi:hypothetical protein
VHRGDRDRERVELRVGAADSAVVPRLLRVLDGTPYDRELLADDVRMAAAEPFEIHTSPNATPAILADLERALVRAGVTGAKLRAGVPCAPGRHMADDAHAEGPSDPSPAESIDERATPALPLVDRLRAEGETTLRHLAYGAPGCEAELQDLRSQTNTSVDDFRSLAGVFGDTRAAVDAAAGELGRLPDVRRAVDRFAIKPEDARNAYGAMSDAVLGCVGDGPSQRHPPLGMSSRSRGSEKRPVRPPLGVPA